MSELETKLRDQIVDFLQEWYIVTANHNQTYRWRSAVECDLGGDIMDRLLDCIVDGLVSQGITDIEVFETGGDIALAEGFALIRELVDEHLGRLLGVE